MAPLKSLGPDDFGAVFYQKYWKAVRMEVSEAVLSILNRERMSPYLNSTFIALIPKKSNVESISDFRLINFCNVLYKLIFKVITNRLKPIMNDIIFSNQSDFIA